MNFDRGDNREMDISKLAYLLHQFDVILSSIIENKILFKNEQIYSMLADEWKNQLDSKLSFLGSRVLSLDEYAEPLKNAGLTGNQLTLKFNIFNNFMYGEVLNDRDFIANPPHKLPILTKRIISGFFDFFNSLLGSLSNVIPMVESIKEFKDMVHFEIKYGAPYETIK